TPRKWPGKRRRPSDDRATHDDKHLVRAGHGVPRGCEKPLRRDGARSDVIAVPHRALLRFQTATEPPSPERDPSTARLAGSCRLGSFHLVRHIPTASKAAFVFNFSKILPEPLSDSLSD